MLESVSVLNHTVLDFVQVTGCTHADGGLYLKGRVNYRPSQS